MRQLLLQHSGRKKIQKLTVAARWAITADGADWYARNDWSSKGEVRHRAMRYPQGCIVTSLATLKKPSLTVQSDVPDDTGDVFSRS